MWLFEESSRRQSWVVLSRRVSQRSIHCGVIRRKALHSCKHVWLAQIPVNGQEIVCEYSRCGSFGSCAGRLLVGPWSWSSWHCLRGQGSHTVHSWFLWNHTTSRDHKNPFLLIWAHTTGCVTAWVAGSPLSLCTVNQSDFPVSLLTWTSYFGPKGIYEDRLKIDRSEDRKVFSQVQLYVYKQEHYKYILPYLVVPSIHKQFEFLYSWVQLCILKKISNIMTCPTWQW